VRRCVVGRVVEAVYEDGVLKPLEDPGLPEHQRVLVEVRGLEEDIAGRTLAAWEAVYGGLSADEVAEVERVALDRSNFVRTSS
jgi:predicted DNA-binding antitoxin AbrB/MazE fold protein